MIEVVEKGVLYPDRTFEIRCRLCRSLLRFKGSDVVVGVDIESIVCPVCEAWLHVGPAKNVVDLKDVTP